MRRESSTKTDNKLEGLLFISILGCFIQCHTPKKKLSIFYVHINL